MAVLNKILPMAMAMAVAACHEDFIPDVDSTPVLCINSLITAGRPVEVEVSHTWMYSEAAAGADHSVPDARVTVFSNGRVVGEDYLPAEGDHIRIVAESAVYGRAEAEVRVPRAVPIKKLVYTPVVTYCSKDDNPESGMSANVVFNLRLELTIDDPAACANFYRYSYTGYNKSYDGDNDYPPGCELYLGSLDYEAEPLFGEHIGVFESIMGGDSYGFTFFTDRQINGSSYTLDLRYKDISYYLAVPRYDEAWLDCGFNVVLSSISPSYYNWANYSWQCNNGPLGDLGDMGFGDPIWGYSNVSTGAGVVAAQAQSVHTISFKDFLKETLYTNQ